MPNKMPDGYGRSSDHGGSGRGANAGAENAEVPNTGQFVPGSDDKDVAAPNPGGHGGFDEEDHERRTGVADCSIL